jgi:hypothetical protein
MEEYIEDSLVAGSINPSASPAIAGFFFEENKTLRLCNEYQDLNLMQCENVDFISMRLEW